MIPSFSNARNTRSHRIRPWGHGRMVVIYHGASRARARIIYAVTANLYFLASSLNASYTGSHKIEPWRRRCMVVVYAGASWGQAPTTKWMKFTKKGVDSAHSFGVPNSITVSSPTSAPAKQASILIPSSNPG